MSAKIASYLTSRLDLSCNLVSDRFPLLIINHQRQSCCDRLGSNTSSRLPTPPTQTRARPTPLLICMTTHLLTTVHIDTQEKGNRQHPVESLDITAVSWQAVDYSRNSATRRFSTYIWTILSHIGSVWSCIWTSSWQSHRSISFPWWPPAHQIDSVRWFDCSPPNDKLELRESRNTLLWLPNDLHRSVAREGEYVRFTWLMTTSS
jgi:hypothetical protein